MDRTRTLPGDLGRGRGLDRPAALLALSHTPAAVARLTLQIYDNVLAGSANVVAGNFSAIAASDLRLLFDRYDAAFFDGLLGAMLAADRADLTFRLSRRMTKLGGTTTHLSARRPLPRGVSAPPDRYEIAVSTVLLFGTFHHVDRPVTVGGLACRDRLEALQRIFEHELLHLAEFLAWGESSCDGENFHRLSQQIFAHAGVRHDLVTPRELAATTYDVRVGDRVSFEHEGVRRHGQVNRITRAATVLVEDPDGLEYNDGKRYSTFYVPVAQLRKDEAPGRGQG